MGLITFLHLKSAGRPERMGHNTMGRVLCVVRRKALKYLYINRGDQRAFFNFKSSYMS